MPSELGELDTPKVQRGPNCGAVRIAGGPFGGLPGDALGLRCGDLGEQIQEARDVGCVGVQNLTQQLLHDPFGGRRVVPAGHQPFPKAESSVASAVRVAPHGALEESRQVGRLSQEMAQSGPGLHRLTPRG